MTVPSGGGDSLTLVPDTEASRGSDMAAADRPAHDFTHGRRDETDYTHAARAAGAHTHITRKVQSISAHADPPGAHAVLMLRARAPPTYPNGVVSHLTSLC